MASPFPRDTQQHVPTGRAAALRVERKYRRAGPSFQSPRSCRELQGCIVLVFQAFIRGQAQFARQFAAHLWLTNPERAGRRKVPCRVLHLFRAATFGFDPIHRPRFTSTDGGTAIWSALAHIICSSFIFLRILVLVRDWWDLLGRLGFSPPGLPALLRGRLCIHPSR